MQEAKLTTTTKKHKKKHKQMKRNPDGDTCNGNTQTLT